MARPPKLTAQQVERLGRLEPSLRKAVRRGDYPAAKTIAADIQRVLRATGHETRLMQAKNWLFEAAMEADRLGIAMAGLEGVRQSVRPRTRVYLEATALLAICHLRQRALERAEPLIGEVLANDSVIRSERRRRQFRRRVVARFEEEGLLAALKNRGNERLEVDEIDAEAGRSVQSKTEDEMLADLGSALPQSAIHFLLRVDQAARRQLPISEIRYLPPPRDLVKKSELGRTISSSLTRVLWGSLCDPESEIYRAWYSHGFAVVLSKKYITSCVVAALSGLGIGLKALAVSLVALVVKFGVEVWCNMNQPKGIMLERSE